MFTKQKQQHDNNKGTRKSKACDIREQKPAMFIFRDHNNFQQFVNRINAAPPAIPWFGIHSFPINANQLQDTFFGKAAIHGGGSVGNTMIAPNTKQQFDNVKMELCNVGLDDYIVGLHNSDDDGPLTLPIAKIYASAHRSKLVSAVPDPGFCPPEGVHLFE